MNVGKKWHVAAAVITVGSWVRVDGERVKNLWQRMRGQTEKAKQDVVTTLDQDPKVVNAKTDFPAAPQLVGYLVDAMGTTLKKASRGLDDALNDLREWDVNKLSDHFSGDGTLRSVVTGMANVQKMAKFAVRENCSEERLNAIEKLNAFYGANEDTLTSIHLGTIGDDAPEQLDEFIRLVQEGVELMQAVVSSAELK